MSLKSFLVRVGLAMGVLEAAPQSPLDTNDLVIVTCADTFEGIINTSHDVLVKGVVHGGIITPEKMVEITETGCVVGSILHADTIVWRGQLGSIKAICRTLIIEAGASNIAGVRAPGITYERLHITDCSSVAVRLHFAHYEDSLQQLASPIEDARIPSSRNSRDNWKSTVVELQSTSNHRPAFGRVKTAR